MSRRQNSLTFVAIVITEFRPHYLFVKQAVTYEVLPPIATTTSQLSGLSIPGLPQDWPILSSEIAAALVIMQMFMPKTRRRGDQWRQYAAAVGMALLIRQIERVS